MSDLKARRLTRRLATELNELDDEQRRAVLHEGNVALTAGPGSGKTRTLVARAAFLLETDVSPFRRLGCITYAKPAAAEITERLGHFGADIAFRTTSRTFHSFCLNEILRPFATLGNLVPPSRDSVIAERSTIASKLRQESYDAIGIPELEPDYRLSELCAIRRALACEDDVSSFDEREVEAGRMFEARLADLGLIDYEAMVSRAFSLVKHSAQVRDLLCARYPHLLVDEYQDLGGVLHGLVEHLREHAGVQIFAVGDVDQNLYAFTGANPKYLNELKSNPHYEPMQLAVNYRSSPNLLPLFSAALGIDHGRVGAKGKVPGKYALWDAEGGLDEHARIAVEQTNRLLGEGVAPDQVAILYPGRGRLLDALVANFASSGLEYFHVRDENLPSGDVFNFIRRCAQRMHRLSSSSGRTSNTDPTLERLASEYQELRLRSSLPRAERRLVLRVLQVNIDDAAMDGTSDNEMPIEWIQHIGEMFDLPSMQEEGSVKKEESWEQIEEFAEQFDTFNSFVRHLDPTGKVILTTYHGAKGLEYEAVILPGLVDGIVPGNRKKNGKWALPTGEDLEEARRAFYVAVTRAGRELVFIYGNGYQVTPDWFKKAKPSIFLREMGALLRSAAGTSGSSPAGSGS